MGRRSWILLAFLAGFWGASYMFIKVALDGGVSPFGVVFVRTALAALVLLPIAKKMGALSGLGSRSGPIALLALVQVAAPFTLISLGEREIPSALAGILVASAPIFTSCWPSPSRARSGRAGPASPALASGSWAWRCCWESTPAAPAPRCSAASW